jgi:hypothetical protein
MESALAPEMCATEARERLVALVEGWRQRVFTRSGLVAWQHAAQPG